MKKQLARNLRKNPTDAERLLWYKLRDRQAAGYKFRRQHVIGPFIVDFVCLAKKLVIEVDGGQHAEMMDQDHRITEYLNNNGYMVMRFWNNEVLQNIEGILQMIYSTLSNDNNPPSSQPSPPKKPGGKGVKG